MESKYLRQVQRTELRAADGSCINYSVSAHMLDNGYQDQFPGSTLVECVSAVEVAPYERVLIDSGIPERHWPHLRASMNRALNMTPDAGRPSDAMRSAVWAFRNGASA